MTPQQKLDQLRLYVPEITPDDERGALLQAKCMQILNEVEN